MRHFYGDDSKTNTIKEKFNYGKFAELFELELNEVFTLHEAGNYANSRRFKITRYGSYTFKDSKWERACNLESAMLGGAWLFRNRED